MKWYSTSRNEYIEISDMTISHIYNTINCLKGSGKSKIHDPFFGLSHNQWLKVFEQELNIRNNKQIIYELW